MLYTHMHRLANLFSFVTLAALSLLTLILILGLALPLNAHGAGKNSGKISPVAPSGSKTSLRQSVQQALSYNPTLKIAQERRIGAEHDIDRAKAGYFPKIRASAGGGLVQQNSPYSRSLSEERDAQGATRGSITLTQPLWDGLSTYGTVGVRTARLDSAEHRLHNTALTLAFDTIVAHIDILQRRELLTLATGNVQNHEKVLTLQMNNQTQGFSSLGEVRQVESRLARARATLSEYMQSLEKAETNYLRLTGRRAPQTLALAQRPSRLFKTLGEARESSKHTNPLARAAMSEISAARSEETVARSAFSPRINVEVGPHWSNQAGKSVGDQSGMSAWVNATWEIYSGGTDMANTKMTAAQTRQMRQELHAVLDNLDGDIRDTWEQVRISRTLIEEYSKGMKAACEARDVYEYQFSMGTRSLLDVLDVESEYFTSASQYILSRSNEVIGQYRLLGLAGLLLEELSLDKHILGGNIPTLPDDISVQGIMSMSNLDDGDIPLKRGGY